MVFPRQDIVEIVGVALAMVAIGASVLKRPSLRAARAFFLAAALWMMGWSAVAYVTTGNRSIQTGVIFVAFELVMGALLVAGLQWIRSNAPSLRAKTLRLAEEIEQFVAMRRETRPELRFMVGYDEAAHWNAANASAIAAHDSETGKRFYERFATRVMYLREELSQSGIVDDQLEAVPTADDDMATVGQRLRALADKLPAA